MITTGGSYGAAEGRRKQTKGRSKNKEWMNVRWEFGEREENVNKINIVWFWWEVDVTIGKYGEGIQDEIGRTNFVLDLGLSLTFSWAWV